MWFLMAGGLMPGRRLRRAMALYEAVAKVLGDRDALEPVDLGNGVDTCLSRYRSMESTETYSILHSPPQHEAKPKLKNPLLFWAEVVTCALPRSAIRSVRRTGSRRRNASQDQAHPTGTPTSSSGPTP